MLNLKTDDFFFAHIYGELPCVYEFMSIPPGAASDVGYEEVGKDKLAKLNTDLKT